MTKLTPAQRKALSLYADGRARNETASKIHGKVYESLRSKGLIERRAFLMSCITDAGRDALTRACVREGELEGKDNGKG